MKVIIAGGRNFNNYSLLYKKCEHFLQNCEEVEIVSGGARGADAMGEIFAQDKGYELKRFPADWNDMSKPCRVGYRKDGSKYNKLAGPKRNAEMAEYADSLIVFWDGKSSGTKNMIGCAKKCGLKIKEIEYF